MSSIFRRHQQFFSEDRLISSIEGWGSDVSTTAAVSESEAMRVVAYWAAIRTICDISVYPLDAYTKAGKLRKEVPLPTLFADLKSDGRLKTWLTQGFYGYAVHGNAVGQVLKRDAIGNPTQIVWLARSSYAPPTASSPGQWTVNGVPVPSGDIFHIPWIVPPGKMLGLNPLEVAAGPVEAAQAAQEMGTDLHRNGGYPPDTFKNTRKTLDAETAQAVKDRVRRTKKGGGTLVFGADWEYDTIDLPDNQAQYIESQKLNAAQIAAIFGLDPIDLAGATMDSGKLTYQNEEIHMMGKLNLLMPYIERFEEAFDSITPDGVQIRFNTDAKLRSDNKSRMESYQIQITTGIRTVDEVRTLEDLPPLTAAQKAELKPKPEPVPAPTPKPDTEDGSDDE